MLLSKGIPVLQVRFSHLVLTAAIAGLLFHATRSYRQGGSFTFDVEDTTPVGDILPEEEYLERLNDHYGLTNFTKWQAWRVQSSEQSLDLSPITDIHANFQPHWDKPKVIDISNPAAADLRAAKRMELPIHTNPAYDKLCASKFLFGISTSYARVADKNWTMLRAWKRWLTKSDGTTNGAGLVLMLDNATGDQLDEVDKLLHDAGIDAYAASTAEPTSKARRYYELTRVMKTYATSLAASGQEKYWFGVVEDTIFFPSLSYLQERLSSYDTSEQLYIGIPSEKMDWQQDGSSVTTYGGGAILLTKPALGIIPKLPCMEAGSSGPPFKAQKWDVVLKECVRKWAGIDMHVIPAFYSPHDTNYRPHLENHETGIRPLLLHDYQDRHRLDVGMAHLVTDVCGEACFMHQYLFHDNWVVINGVSISHHPDGLKHHHRHEDEGLEDDRVDKSHKTHLSGQIVINEDKVERKPLTWTGRKEVWTLLDSAKAANGSIWQAYLKKGVKSVSKTPEEEVDELEELDSVIVLIWESRKHS